MKNNTLQECLNYIQVNLNAPKNLHNAFGNYKYRNLEGIFEGLKPLLEETGCIVTISDSIEMLGDRYYIKAVVSIYKGNESMTCHGWARETEVKKGMDESQITGSASSYARKYAMNGMFAIDDVKDADSMDNTYTITDAQKEKYQELLNSGAYANDKAKANKWWKGLSTEQQAEAGLKSMQKQVDAYIEQHKEKE